MPLHNTEDLKAGPTSQLESEVLNEKTETYELAGCRRFRS
jgi:hypothetical protein